ncbi:MAG: pyrroline-5-carboxylate reductase [Candidatus Omnitrophica bacterium]|nr:pyrroline-5-carboxylate reductase [Candidatus Omnitrophota bacterium]
MLKTITIIGGGNMGESLIKGLHKSNSVTVVEANAPRVAYLKKTYRVKIAEVSDAIKSAGIIILAVKPQDMGIVLDSIKKDCKTGKLVISIAAGLTTKFFEKGLAPSKIAVVRSMPNMPALIGQGITGLCAGRYAKPSDIKTAQAILNTIGQTVVVQESMIDALTAVSGSGPAYVFLLVECWMNAAKSLGFKEEEAKALVYQTLIGSAHLLEQSDFTAAELRTKVTSKGGTTQAAMDVFTKGRLDSLIKQALLAAKKRAKELAK